VQAVELAGATGASAVLNAAGGDASVVPEPQAMTPNINVTASHPFGGAIESNP
jgi:hypothetical protein